ncbi:hypothetical protein [Flagellimonas sp.]|uniref:hypothetical protein n=1 Tax=Flagellimonas sp. TaxID=2058762 RepID=UPI003B503435
MILLIGCTDEPNESNFLVSIKNESSHSFAIRGFKNNSIVYQEILNNNENGTSCGYTDENFRGIFVNHCGIDSLVLEFNDNRGYISTYNNSGNFNFSNKRNPLLPNSGFNINENTYEFLVTIEDYENAFELPE